MTRALRIVRPGEDVGAALRAALAGGDAVLPVADDRPREVPVTVPRRIALVVETSGSTGVPKRVALTTDALLASAAASESALGGPAQWVLALPTHYIAGLNVLVRSAAAETEPVAVPGDGFSAAGFVAACTRLLPPQAGGPARAVALVPAQLRTLLDDPAALAELRGFQAVLVGGQATPATLVDEAAEAGIRVVRSYGSSETSGGCVYDGVPIGATRVRVVDGEVRIGGPVLADHYLGDPARTDERFVEDGGVRWFRTADAGEWDGERLSVTGRRDDVVVSGGVKVALGAVERVLREQPGFSDAVVVGAPHERWGEAPVAVTASADDPADAIAAVGRELGRAARPARVIRVDALPLLASGKPDRAALARLARD